MLKRRFLYWLALIFIPLACHVPPSTPENIDFIILQLNDVYEIAPVAGGKEGGLARVATIKKELLRENPNTIAILSGDFLSPSLIGNLKMPDGERIAGLQMVETLNALGLDYVTFGNHEFDFSDPALLKKRMDQSDFRYICSNVRLREGGQLKPFTQRIDGRDEPVPSFLVRTFSNSRGDKVRVAFTGVILPFTRQEYLEYLPVRETFLAAVREAQAQSELCLGITHLDVATDLELARETPGVPLYMGGHDHDNMNHYVENTIITKADANARTVYIHRVSYNPMAGMVNIRSTLRHIDESIPDDPATKAVVDKWQDMLETAMVDMGFEPYRYLMTATEPLVCTETDIRNRPTNFGRLTASAMAYVWPGADAYILNSGTMRLDDNLQGEVTVYDVLRTLPYGGPVVKMTIPGKAFREILRIGLVQNKGQGGYLQTSEIGFDNGQWVVGGAPLEEDRNYVVVMPQFLAEGKESNLEQLGAYTFEEPDKFETSNGTVRNDMRDIVIAHMEQLGKK